MPMKSLPPFQSNRPLSGFEQSMQASAAPAPTGGLSGIKSAVLQNQNLAPQSTAYLRQAVTQGPPTTTASDLQGLTNEYTNWQNSMISQGYTNAQIVAMPTFQNYQNRLTQLIGTVTDPTLIQQNIDGQNARIAQGGPAAASATAIRDAFVAQQNKVAPATGAATTTPTTGPVPAAGAAGAAGATSPSVYSGIDPDIMQQIIQNSMPAASTANAASAPLSAGAPSTSAPALAGAAAPASAPGVAPTAPAPSAAPATGITGALSAPAPAPTPLAPNYSGASPVPPSNVQPMSMTTTSPSPVGSTSQGGVTASLQGGTPSTSNVQASNMTVTPPAPIKQSQPAPVTGLPSTATLAGTSPAPAPVKQTSMPAPTSALSGVSSGTPAGTTSTGSSPGAFDPATSMDESTRSYLSAISGQNV